MISAKISIFQTTKYTEEELSNMTRNDQLSIRNFGYEKVVQEIGLVEQTFKNTVQLQNKILELCRENEVLFISVENYVNNEFLVGKKYQLQDPNAIFEMMFFTILNQSTYTKFILENIQNGITTNPCIRVVHMVIGKDLHKMTYYNSQYFKIHKLSENLSSVSNLIHDLPTSTWHRVDPLYRSQKKQLRLTKQKLQEDRTRQVDSDE